MKSFIQSKIWPVTVGTILILAAGCGRDSVKVYHVENQDTATPAPPPVAAPTAMPTTMPNGLPVPDNSGLPSLNYTQPDGWEKKAPSAMRVASFGVSQDGKQADISVIPLGGMAGTDPANVNRWRGQVGLGALSETDIPQLAEKVTVGDAPADLYDLTGTAPGGSAAERILGVILHRDDTSWFFKMTGDADLVEAQKPAFVSFLKSVSFGPPTAAPAATDMSQLPPSHPPIDGINMGAASTPAPDAAANPTWTVPAGWQVAPLEQFLVARYVIAGADGAQAAVNVSSLVGDGGGLLANVNRWRGQIGLPPISETDLPRFVNSIDVGNGKSQIVDCFTIDPKTGRPVKIVGVIVPQNGQTWFYKLIGDGIIVQEQKDAFIKFVESAQYPDAH